MVTSYSFLTRMVYSESKKVVNEWFRVLNDQGRVLTTVRVTDGKNEGEFYHSKSNETIWAQKLEAFINEAEISEDEAAVIRNKVSRYMNNIMSCSLSVAAIENMFGAFNLILEPFDHPGELIPIHKMLSINATKRV